MNHENFKEQAVEFMMGRGWKQITAKSKEFQQSLFDHTLAEIDALITLLPILRSTFSPPLSEQEELILLVSLLAHDVGKEREIWQEYRRGERGFESDVDPELTRQVVPQLAALFECPGVEDVISNVLLHMRGERTTANVMRRVVLVNHENPRWKTLSEIVDAVDNICSAAGLFGGLETLQRSQLGGHVRTEYHLANLRGVSTMLLHRAAIDAFLDKGWSPLLHYSNGTIYVASSTSTIIEPTADEIGLRLASGIERAIGGPFANLVVPTDFGGSPLPKPELFDYREIKQYLQVAAKREGREAFRKKSETERREIVDKYLLYKESLVTADADSTISLSKATKKADSDWRTGKRPAIDNDLLNQLTERISASAPEVNVFRFFKAAVDEKLVGKEVAPQAKEDYASMVGDRGKSKGKSLQPADIAQVEFEKVFGERSWERLKAIPNRGYALSAALIVDPFWSLDGVRFGKVDKVEHLIDHAERERILIDALSAIAEKVYASVPEENRPQRASPEEIARCFLADLIHPAPALDLDVLAKEQLQAYSQTKVNARRDRGLHLCPICNVSFEGGTQAKADFVDAPEAHTNRAVSHGGGGHIVICDACKFERFLQQLILGSKVSSMIVLFPRMNIGHGSGEILRRKAIEIWEEASRRMSDASPDPDRRLSLGLSFNIARQLANVDVFRLTPAEIVKVITYQSSDETAKKNRNELKKQVAERLEVEPKNLTVELLNESWDTGYATLEEAIEAVMRGEVTDSDAIEARRAALKFTPQLRIACQTPHMILVPLANPIAMGDESDTNVAIRELLVALLLGLSLDCSVAVIKLGESITFEGGEGVARVSPVPALRDLIGSEWVSVEDAPKWLHAISAAALLAGATAFPERSNLYAILSSPTTGHIMRRIDQQEDKQKAEGKPPFSMRQRSEHIKLLETLKGVLR